MTTPTLFTLQPDGAESRVERLVWNTDIQIGRDGSETRTALSARPRLYYGANYRIWGDKALQLAPLKAGGAIYLPLAQHRTEGNGSAPTPDAIYLTGTGRFLVRNSLGIDRQVVGDVSAGIPNWQPNDLFAVPLAEATLTDDSFGIETVGSRTVSVSLDFLVETVDERALLALHPPVLAADGKPVLEFRHNGTTLPTEEYTHSTNRFDEGHLTSVQVRHTKRAIDVQFLLRSREEIGRFRAFCYAIKGAAKPFRFTAQQATGEQVFRLASDEVVIEYIKPRLATVALRLIEVAE